MKKTVYLFALIILLSACGEQNASQNKLPQPTDESYSFSASNLSSGCASDSEMICAVNLTVKCAINPDLDECGKNKALLPDFVFMRDESLDRPQNVSYRIEKLKPLPDGSVEVHTLSECDGKWFGLCNGNIIYVMKPAGSGWRVAEIYAMQY